MDEHRIHQVFQLSLLLKGAHAVIECLFGIALAVVATRRIVNLVNALTQEELIEDPKDFVATHLLAMAENFSLESKHFYAFYLLSHGVLKLLLVIALLRGNLWSVSGIPSRIGSLHSLSALPLLIHAWHWTDPAHPIRYPGDGSDLARIPARAASSAGAVASIYRDAPRRPFADEQ
jgi:hypothetical protein